MKFLAALLILACASIARPQEPEPRYIAASGAGYDAAAQRHWSTWYTIGVKISATTWATAATDFSVGGSSTRAGFETVIIRLGGVVLTAKGDAGMLSSLANLGSAFSGGGSLLIPVAKLSRIPGAYLVSSVTLIHAAVGGGTKPVYRFGFGGAW